MNIWNEAAFYLNTQICGVAALLIFTNMSVSVNGMVMLKKEVEFSVYTARNVDRNLIKLGNKNYTGKSLHVILRELKGEFCCILWLQLVGFI